MTPEDLLEEGRALARPSLYLTPAPNAAGPVAVWHERPTDSAGGDAVPWLTFRASDVPGLLSDGTPLLTLHLTGTEGGGVVAHSGSSLPSGTPLFGEPFQQLPPIDAIFRFGSARVGEWLAANGWRREWGFNSNFKGAAAVDVYERAWQEQVGLYDSDDRVWAQLGGWSMPWPDGDWDERLEDTFVAWTFHQAEPWVEVWQTPAGEFRVIQRET